MAVRTEKGQVLNLKELDLSGRYNYADYLTWKFNETVELIRGQIFKMSPAPGLLHQRVSSNFHGIIFAYLKRRPCDVFHAPFDVRLPLPPDKVKDDEIETVVQPDICVICDQNKLDPKGCIGAPDWIIEILSPATSQKDLGDKFDIYENAGVKEYWIAHPHEHTLLVYRLGEDGKFYGESRPFVCKDVVRVGIFEDFQINLEEVFPEVRE